MGGRGDESEGTLTVLRGNITSYSPVSSCCADARTGSFVSEPDTNLLCKPSGWGVPLVLLGSKCAGPLVVGPCF